MLESHVRFLALRKVDASRRIKNSIIQAIAALQENPERFPFLDVHGIPKNVYRKLFIKIGILCFFKYRARKSLSSISLTAEVTTSGCWGSPTVAQG